MIQPEAIPTATAAVSDTVWLALIASLPTLIAAIFVGLVSVLTLWLSWRSKKEIVALKDDVNGHMTQLIAKTATVARAEGAATATAAVVAGVEAAKKPEDS